MLLETVHERLGWPSRREVLQPSGAGPAFLARLVRAKLGRILSRRSDVAQVEVGVLAGDPSSDSTEPPLAVICEFNTAVGDGTLEEAHWLAWNFCRAPVLITLEPHIIRTWTTCERPRLERNGKLPEAEIEPLRIDPRDAVDFSQAAARSLSWISLASGQLFREHEARFPRQKCADETLLDNLKAIRTLLVDSGVAVETVHDLLARLMFVQFLMHRKDDQGRAALTSEWLRKQYDAGTLSGIHHTLESVLRNHADAYSLFRLLNERFNGDLFPGKASEPKQREEEWRAEMKEVKASHLNLLADFVGGKMQIRNGQKSLWPLYSFDVIPLEFISSIYEAFVTKQPGTHYTPGYLVDIALDTCLPWNDDRWDVKVLDPACGSGIFLVKAFQRILYRWHRAHKFRKKPSTDLLRRLLTENLFGVDIQKEAVRVSSFSLYLAMCDELEPRYIWDRVKFPLLRESRLIAADFFREDVPGFRSLQESQKYDVIVGNAPWGMGTVTKSQHAKKWARDYRWDISYEDIGPLFLAKGAKLAKSNGRISMLQSSGLLFKTTGKAASFRTQLFKKHKVEQIVNLSALRFGLFADAVGPACIFSLRPSPPDASPICYVTPKPTRTADDDFRIIFEAYDYHLVTASEAQQDPRKWVVLMWGGPRDYSLLARLSNFSSLEKLEEKRLVRTRRGIVRGDRGKRQDVILNRHILETDDFPNGQFPYLNADDLPRNSDPFIESDASTRWESFDAPQLLLKLAWLRANNRFQSRIVQSLNGEGVLCSQSYVSVHFEPGAVANMGGACLAYNSKMAIYFMLLTSSRFASFRQAVQTDELLRVPLPAREVDLKSILSPADVDRSLREGYPLKLPEWILIDDAVEHTMQAFTRDIPNVVTRVMLEQYGEAFARVLRAGFGDKKRIRMTFYLTPDESKVPVQLLAAHLDWPGDDDGVQFHHARTDELLQQLVDISHRVEQRSFEGTTTRRRVFHVYETTNHRGKRISTLYLCKPHLARYWTRSMAMRDADVVSADLVRFSAAKQRRRRMTSV